jgi:hypothetical protein
MYLEIQNPDLKGCYYGCHSFKHLSSIITSKSVRVINGLLAQKKKQKTTPILLEIELEIIYYYSNELLKKLD